MNDVVSTTNQLWDKIQAGDLKAFTFSDIIWAIGIIVITYLAIKVGYKLAKFLLVILVIGLIIGYLIYKGIIPV